MVAPFPPSDRPRLTVRMASPRGFCAGVDRAIQIVERALEKFGAPVFVRHEIVHNRYVVERLKAMGAVFVTELDQCPDDRPVIFSAHGVPKSVPQAAKARNLVFLDATCPLVSKVHLDVERHVEAGREILLIGHAGHPEVIGTLGQAPPGAVTLIETVQDAQSYQPRNPDNIAFVTQTTLSVDDTADVIDTLRARFPSLAGPHREDICYATTNRQDAVKRIAAGCEIVLVVGSKRSSNSQRLVEVAERAGAGAAHLIDSADDIDPAWLIGATTLGLTAGASAPEVLVDGVLDALAKFYDIAIEETGAGRETVTFKLPRLLLDA